MISIIDKEKCCGCNACGDICNQHAITFHLDREGFWYPRVDPNLCTNCGMCERTCPQLVKYDQKHYHLQTPRVFAAYSKDEDIRMDSKYITFNIHTNGVYGRICGRCSIGK